MNVFAKNEIIILFLSLAVMLGMAKIIGEIFTKLKFPSVIGEILAGIVIGPTVLGRFFPDIYKWLFPTGSHIYIALETLILLGVVLFLLIAGLEVDLSSVWKQGKTVILVSILSLLFPFVLGAIIPSVYPEPLGSNNNQLITSLFIGIALSITSLPIIAKILIDMKLFQSDIGIIIITSAMIKDLIGWLFLSVIIQIVLTGNIDGATICKTIFLTVTVTVLILTLLRYIINQTLPWIQANTSWPGGVISFIIAIGLIFSSLTEAIGLHAIFGAFLAGIAIGDSPHLREHTKDIINQFINNIFAPLFFVSIGLRIDFIHNFNLSLSVIFILITIFGKISSTVIAGKFTDIKLKESMAIGSGMSATGAMGIIIGLFAHQHGIIHAETYEAIVIMAIVTSLLSAPLMKFFLKSEKKLNILDLIKNKLFIQELKAGSVKEAIQEMSLVIAKKIKIKSEFISEKVLEREYIMSTGIGDNIAIPHARLMEIKNPYIIVGKSKTGIDFDAPDGKPAHLIFMILTPYSDQETQIQILAELSNLFINKKIKELAITANNYTEFILAIKMAPPKRIV